MFKKKPNIPPRPKPPITGQMLEDLKKAPEDDDVFRLMKNETNRDCLQNSGDTTTSTTVSAIMNDDMTNPEFVFQKVKNFVEVNRNLQQIMQDLLLQNEALQMSDRELKSMVEEIRKQALNALK